jgi:simple sugar transport system permease protein
MKNTLLDLYKKDGTKKLLASLISILIGLTVGAAVVIVVGLAKNTIGIRGVWDGVRLIFFGILSTGREAGKLTWGYNSQSLGNMLFRATPLIMTGLSVALANKTGLFNIGAPGQYLMGTMATLAIVLGIPAGTLPGWLLWMLAFLGGMVAGAIWGAIPGALKAFLNINEVLACIMTNWLAANIVTWAFDVSNFKNMVEGTKTGYIYKTTYGLTNVDGVWTYVEGNGIATPKMGLNLLFPNSQVNGGILIAVLLAVLVYVLMNKTTLGFELKACGSNRHAARYAGINDKRNIVLSMAIAGALSAAGASLYWLSGNTEFYWNTSQSLPAIGFNGIPVALLAVNNPIAVIFSAIFMAMLNIVGNTLSGLTAYNEYITDVIIAVIVYLSAFSLVVRMWLSGKKKKVELADAAPVPAEPTPAEPIQEGGENP